MNNSFVKHSLIGIVIALLVSPVLAVQTVTDAASELDELDLLSRSNDDAFPQQDDRALRKPVSVTLRALDKITARYTDIEAVIDEVAYFGSLELLPRYCDKRPPEEFPETTAFLQVFDKEKKIDADAPTEAEPGDEIVSDAVEVVQGDEVSDAEAERARFIDELTEVKGEYDLDVEIAGESIFNGWMFASSPGLNGLEHAVYDVWVIDCKTTSAENE